MAHKNFYYIKLPTVLGVRVCKRVCFVKKTSIPENIGFEIGKTGNIIGNTTYFTTRIH
jgi:hypothetical protein